MVRVKIIGGFILLSLICLLLSLFLSGKFGGDQSPVDTQPTATPQWSDPSQFNTATITPSPLPTRTPFVYDNKVFFPPDAAAQNPPHPDNLVLATQAAASIPGQWVGPSETPIPFVPYYKKTETARTPAVKTVQAGTPTPTQPTDATPDPSQGAAPTNTLIPFVPYYIKTQNAKSSVQKAAETQTAQPQPGLANGVSCEIMMNGKMTQVDCHEWGLDKYALISGQSGSASSSNGSNQSGNTNRPSIPAAAGTQLDEIIRISYYNPALGGTNCGSWVNGTCVSNMAVGLPWKPWVGKAVACPQDWPFYTRVIIPDGTEWVCLDHGGAIKYVNGTTWIDFLNYYPPYPFGSLVKAKIIFP